MRFLILFSTVLGLLMGALSLPAAAQGLGSLMPTRTAADEAPNIDEIMQKAAENGVGVVVIDREGNLLSQDSAVTAPPAQEGEASASALMETQDQIVKFRSALIDRLLQLPDAFAEVGYILRAASPDGTITAFGKAVLYSALLFAAGAFVEAQVFGKRIARSFVVARIQENPRGYVE